MAFLMNGIREGRTAFKPLPDVSAEVLADQLAAVSDLSFEERLAIATAQQKELPNWAPQRPIAA